MSQQGGGAEGVDPGVDLRQRVLSGSESLLLDNGLDLGGAGRWAQDATVAGRVIGRGRQDGHRRLLGLMKAPKPRDSLGADQRRVAGEHQNVLVAGDGLAGALDGVAGAALLCLFNEANARGGHRGLHPLRLVANDDENPARLHDAAGGGDDVRQQRLAADLVQHLGPLRLEPGSLARRHDDHS